MNLKIILELIIDTLMITALIICISIICNNSKYIPNTENKCYIITQENKEIKVCEVEK